VCGSQKSRHKLGCASWQRGATVPAAESEAPNPKSETNPKAQTAKISNASTSGGCSRTAANKVYRLGLDPGYRLGGPTSTSACQATGSTGRWPVGFGGPPKPGSALFTPNPDPLPVKGRGNARRRTV
jgi:hypothetical protein